LGAESLRFRELAYLNFFGTRQCGKGQDLKNAQPAFAKLWRGRRPTFNWEIHREYRFCGGAWYSVVSHMSATEIIEQFKALSASERAQVAKFVVENDDSWIPESFKQAMADAEAGRFVDLDTALNEPYPGDK
jgi:hypothetical protein